MMLAGESNKQVSPNEKHRMDTRLRYIILAVAFAGSALLKIINITAGGPYVTIDDQTTFEGGFLVWFGNAPPQRMFLESWIAGALCLATYIGKTLLSGAGYEHLSINLIADAYRDFYNAPDHYVHVYRWLVLFVDMVTAWMVYCVAKLILKERWRGYAAVIAAAMYLFSFNTVWCNLVARPDSFVAFFGIIGLYWYYRSNFGERLPEFWMAAVALGLCAGMKLHGAFFVVFILLDLLRNHGLTAGMRKALPFVFVAVLFFAVAAGIPLFDPLKYVKLRMLNYRDDISPWIAWGDQFVQIVKGSGWVAASLVLVGAWKAFLAKTDKVDKEVKSTVFFALCWLVLFSLIRQLRAYWMLPALPLVYIAAIFALSEIKPRRWASAIAVGGLALMIFQSYQEAAAFRNADFNGLRRWVSENIKKDEPFYILGYEALNLPRNTNCIEKMSEGLERIIHEDLVQNLPFTLRHLKNWEEQSALTLYDMLNFRNDEGYTYFSFYTAPLDHFDGIISLEDMQYMLVQEHFNLRQEPRLEGYIERNFRLITEQTGPGGGGKGLRYRIFKRKGYS